MYGLALDTALPAIIYSRRIEYYAMLVYFLIVGKHIAIDKQMMYVFNTCVTNERNERNKKPMKWMTKEITKKKKKKQIYMKTN